MYTTISTLDNTDMVYIIIPGPSRRGPAARGGPLFNPRRVRAQRGVAVVVSCVCVCVCLFVVFCHHAHLDHEI